MPEDELSESALEDEADPGRILARQLLALIPDGWSIDRVLRYETNAHRHLVQTVHELEARQARRRGEGAPLARVDFTSPPSAGPPRGSRTSSAVLKQLDEDMTQLRRNSTEARRRALSADS